MKKRKPEILSPAGSMDSLKAAVAAGCDAIYIGGSKFGARAYADNPEEDEMIQAIAYCHLHGKKIYMTVNTLLKEQELGEVYNYLAPYVEAGLDAVIVQDVGVMRMIHHYFPDLSIHASTQMTLTMGESANCLKDYGVDRMVPSRELSLPELRAMRNETDLELEVFVHGALCYCYSGQCLFSSMFGGRSGNRGRCAQPCRLPYEIGKQGKKYYLSPKELCNLPHIGEMIEAGIDSFKIEGRMKRPEYTAFVTAMYRKYVDRYCEWGKEKYEKYLSTHKEEWQEDLRKLAEIYNRTGFTAGYLEGKAGVPFQDKLQPKGDMLSELRPKHGGVLVGIVTKKDGYRVWYEAKRSISSHDVVEFRNEKMIPSYEYTLGEDVTKGSIVEARYQKGSKISVGDFVYRTKDAALLETIRQDYLQEDAIIYLEGKFVAEVGQPVSLSLRWNTVEVSIEGDICSKASKHAATKEEVRRVISQMGNTFYRFQSLEVIVGEQVFLPVGMLKKLRREAVASLEQKILAQSKRSLFPYEKEETKETEIEDFEGQQKKSHIYSASVQTLSQLSALLEESKIGRIYLKMDTMTSEELVEGLQQCHQKQKEAFLCMPHIVREGTYRMWEKKLQCEWKKYKELADGFLVRNMESIHFLKKHSICEDFQIILDAEMYVMNTQAEKFWQEQHIAHRTLPYELTERELASIAGASGISVIVYGHVPLMVSAQCVRYNTKGCMHAKADAPLPNGAYWRGVSMQDQKKRAFRVENYCKYCYNELYMEEPFCLQQEMESFEQMGISEFRYDFLWEETDTIKRIIQGKDTEGNKAHFYHGIE